MTRARWIPLAVALVAAGALLGGTIPAAPQAAPAALTAEQLWPAAQRADLPNLTVDPLYFLDATTAVGTFTDGDEIQLLIEKSGIVRELRRLPVTGEPRFEVVTAAGDELIWTEQTGDGPVEIWAAHQAGGKPRRLTADTGNTLFYGNQHDLVVAGGRVYWTAGDGDRTTQIRSVALTGGAVTVREETGRWALSAWPWLTDDTGGQTGAVHMRNLENGKELQIPFSGAEWAMCDPSWCRVMVATSAGLARIDLMRPDGSDRRRVAGPDTQAAVNDVAVLGRFEILSVPGPNADLTGTAALLVHDLENRRSVPVAVAADMAATKDGVLWWSTGGQEAPVWHTLDLRTI
ncbi:hypothetical protein [Actinoplanes utahensis]|uniref:Uncharacterized protein n=1 Tax=Actinoplanes utahensis TaxID=1869 RepID=A0A0A6UUX6_ACTUT|nr:hypothetical protein [Actinoplanes utahensis]KHD79251.1 hypothetical protein MB27_01170 [Actinoplanes utahensis]GIF30322.1 hypothetical protein Aut01nite_33080 [Actinoplanes utahensis]